MAHGGRKEAAGPIRDVPVGGSREYIMRAPIVGQFGMLAAPDRWIRRRSLGRNGAMIGAVTTITCKRCGLSFQTEATTNTRCRSCRAVVRVPAAARNQIGSGPAGSTRKHTFGIVLLDCGHPAVVVIHPGRSIAATLKGYDWECPDSGATVTATRVLTVLSEAEYENLGQEAFDLLVSSGAAS
jgi:hypothetical protein